ncbi:MAG: DUF3179 domain-containing protein [Armatimonadetes bacterium]|nr:DUF3179 domain-containing protein [Armatimonadota bacterium]
MGREIITRWGKIGGLTLLLFPAPLRAQTAASPPPFVAPALPPPEAAPPGFRPIPGLTDQYGDFRGMFQALTDPKVVPASALTELGDDEEVLGLSLGGQSRAYPARFIAWHHIVNDTLGGRPVLVTYCSVCNTGIAYDPVIGGKRRLFQVFGLYRGVMAMYDPSNDTIWSHIAGEALLGPDKGKTLAALPVVNTTWGEWKRLHPQTTTPDWQTPYREYYGARVVSGRDYLPPMFPATLRGLRDSRLAPNDLVLAVRVEGRPRAYPFAALAAAPDVVQETLGGTPVVALYVPETKTAAAYDCRLDGKTLEFTRAPGKSGLFDDRGTGSRWTVEGECVAGPLRGKHLTRVFSLQAEWYGWSAYFPQTTLYAAPAVTKPAPAL